MRRAVGPESGLADMQESPLRFLFCVRPRWPQNRNARILAASPSYGKPRLSSACTSKHGLVRQLCQLAGLRNSFTPRVTASTYRKV